MYRRRFDRGEGDSNRKGIGPIEVAVFNLGAQIGDRNLQATSYKALKWGGGLLTLVFSD